MCLTVAVIVTVVGASEKKLHALSSPRATEQGGGEYAAQDDKTTPEPLAYHTYETMLAQIQQYEVDNPEICRVHDLGVSSDGKTHMWAVKVSDNVEKEEDEPNVLLTGAIHGNERPAPEMALYTLDHLLKDKKHGKLISETQIWIIPIMNTAGHVANRRQNANGVDLNRGFPADWTNDSLEGLEVETRNLIENFYRKRAHVVAGIDLHTFGQVYLLPYARTRDDPADNAALRVLAERMAQTAGYKPVKLTDFIRRTVQGGGADYRYGKYGTFYYGLELGTSHSPPESTLGGLCERNLPGVLMMMNRVRYATLTGHVTKNGTPVVATVSVAGIDRADTLRMPYKSDSEFGRYFRILLPGTYDVTFERDGDKIVKNDVTIVSDRQTIVDVEFGSVGNRPTFQRTLPDFE